MPYSKQPAWPRQVAGATGALTVLVGVAVLAGRSLHLAAFTTGLAGGPPMSPLAALAFLLAGASLIQRARATSGLTPRIAIAGPLLFIALAIVRLAEQVFHRQSGFETLLLRMAPVVGTSLMVPGTAIGFVLLGTALLLPELRRANLVVSLALAAALIGWLGLSRFLFGGPGLLPFGDMALLTSLALIVAGVGAACLCRKSVIMALLLSDGASGHLARLLLPWAIGMPAALGWVCVRLQQSGWFGTSTGTSLLVLSTVLAFSALFLIVLRSLEASEGRRRSAEEVRERFLSVVQSTDDAVIGKTLEGIVTNWNHGAEIVFGWSAAEMLGRTITALIPPECHAEEAEILDRIRRGERVAHLTTERIRKDGRRILVSATISPIRDDRGRIVGASQIARDMTEQRRAAETQQITDTKLHDLLAHSPALLYSLQIEHGKILPVVVSENVERLLGYSVEEASHFEWWASALHPEDRDRVFALVSRMVAEGGYTTEYRLRHKDGSWRWIEDSNRAIQIEGSERGEAVGVMLDITERRLASDSLHRSEEQFRQLAENIHEVFWMTDPDKREFLYVSPAYERIWERSCQSLYAAPHSWMEAVHPEDRRRVAAAITRQAEGTYDEEYRIIVPDGSVRWIHDRASPIRDERGRVYRIAGVAEDITEKRKLEDQFRQSQKMEAIGQLAGGVAHDFNNLLCVITGHCGLLPLHPAYDTGLDASVQTIQAAADRAATLTRQLLAFSRRQAILPRDLDLNTVVADIIKMMQGLIGESVRIELHFAPQPLIVHADGGMMDQIVLNLAVNARDAMPNGGRLILETSAVELTGDGPGAGRGRTGPFVCLRVSDTGAGIPKEILPRIFEPFFTTKEVGKGTGLGLATVYGIVDQHQGWLTVYSEVGMGTTFCVFLPRVVQPVETAAPDGSAASLPRGSETILVSEDDPEVRALVRMVLAGLGYTVLETATGVEALEVWRARGGEVKLLLTDLAMPDGMSGTDLARHMRETDPGMPVIYMSGYSPEIAGRSMEFQEGVNYLSKPFHPRQLALTVRTRLDTRPTAASMDAMPIA